MSSSRIPFTVRAEMNKYYIDSAITNNTNITLTQAIQPYIKQLGILTELQIDNIKVNGNIILSLFGSLFINPAAGFPLVLDGAINIDSGIVTGAESITSTVFVGDLNGNATGSAATVTGEAQTAIKQVGILTGLAIGGDIDCTGSITGVITTANQQYITRIGSLSQSYFKCVNNEAEVYNGIRFNILTPVTVFNNKLVLSTHDVGASISAINSINTGYGSIYIDPAQVKFGWKNASHVYTSAIDCTNNNVGITGNIIAQGNITASGNNSILSVSANNDTAHTLGNVKIGHVGHNNWAAFSHMDCDNETSYALLQSSDGITNVNAKTDKHIALLIDNDPRLRVFNDQTRLDNCELRIVNADGSMTHFNLANNTRVNYVRGKTEFSQHAYFPAGSTSDDRLKHNEEHITNGLKVLSQLVPKKYDKTQEMLSADYVGDLPSDYIVEAGFIAQEVLETDISFVVKIPDNVETTPYGIDYNCLFTYAVAGIKELDSIVTTQSATITTQAAIITTLEAKLAAQEARIAYIEARIG